MIGRAGRALLHALAAPALLIDRRLPPGKARRAVTTSLGVLAVALLVVTAVMSARFVGHERTQNARAAGLAAAVELTPELLTYDYRTLAADVARAQAATTGEFAGQYRALVEQSLDPNAAQQQFVTKVQVSDSSVVSATPSEVVALLYLSQVTTSKRLTAPRLDNSGVRVTVSEVDGRWLISKLDRI
jgi:Mce-associated membrane protein